MERDFMGLSSKEPLVSVKREITDEASETHWSYTKNSSSHPHSMSSKPGAFQDDWMKKMVSDPITSSAFIASSTVDAFNHGPKASAAEFQNSPLSLSNPVLKRSFSSYGQNAGAAIRQQFQGIPMTVTPSVSPVVGFTDPWNNKKSLGGPAQMTIFYAGSVSVFDEISPEKAQAIMLLAGNGSSLTSNSHLARCQVLSPVTKVAPTVVDAIVSHQPLISQTGPDALNQSSVPSHSTMRISNLPVSRDEQMVIKTTGTLSNPVSKLEAQRAVASRGPMTVPVMTSSAIPQFRKASLARFLEKRKERVMSATPYSIDKKPQEGANPGTENLGSGSNSANSMTNPSAAVKAN